ncbi:hypothetical protein EVAR_51857_1 [Eumeta japonica]|uniref:Uncharacterized protein n=1 Tax=Eumeta variegata TaxID=151549 RepID=A0A4C1YS48_EUMVA|nr:hypothetical protein EVAR_51857_1 [Eumeta japonica]
MTPQRSHWCFTDLLCRNRRFDEDCKVLIERKVDNQNSHSLVEKEQQKLLLNVVTGDREPSPLRERVPRQVCRYRVPNGLDLGFLICFSERLVIIDCTWALSPVEGRGSYSRLATDKHVPREHSHKTIERQAERGPDDIRVPFTVMVAVEVSQ